VKTAHQIDAQFCSELSELLTSGTAIDCDLPDGGHLHIDRQLPFLCVYRRPEERADMGTEQLVTSQASYLIASARAELNPELSALVETIAAAQFENFGGFLLLEIWAKPGEAEHASASSLEIIAPESRAPVQLLENMESALLRARVNDRTPSIELVYEHSISPSDMAPLLDDAQCASIGCTSIGLAINPFFRDPDTGELYVFAHKEFRHRINRALKRCFFSFTHEYTTHRPAHFHELGPRVIKDPVQLVDAALAEINRQFDLLLFVSPVNSAAAWEQFSEGGYEQSVEFHYRPRTIDPALLKRRLYEAPIESIDDPTLAYVYEAKREELDRQVTLLSDRNTPAFLLGSRQLFGDVSPELLQLARDVLEQVPPDTVAAGGADQLNAQQFSAYAHEELDYYRNQDGSLASTIEIRDDIPGIMVSHGNFLIGANAVFSTSRLQATLAHEIGTHIVTYHNGRQQPLQELRGGMAGYETLQEGLAVLSEYLAGELSGARLRQLAGRVLAAHMIVDGADFTETFRCLHQETGFGGYAAFMMTMRTFRGGGYTKDGVYLQGLVDVLEYLAGGNDLRTLYLGKIAHEYIPLVEELRWRQVLRAPTLLPRLFTLPETQEKLERLAEGCTVLDLMMESG
jgi:uncharacterized protein (TIGR02421 family)